MNLQHKKGFKLLNIGVSASADKHWRHFSSIGWSMGVTFEKLYRFRYRRYCFPRLLNDTFLSILFPNAITAFPSTFAAKDGSAHHVPRKNFCTTGTYGVVARKSWAFTTSCGRKVHRQLEGVSERSLGAPRQDVSSRSSVVTRTNLRTAALLLGQWFLRLRSVKPEISS